MPTLTQIKADALIAAATAAMATASANLAAATAASDAAYSAIVAAVKATGYDSFTISGGVVTIPSRLRSWSATDGLTGARTSIGLGSLVTTYNTAAATVTKRQHELTGLQYVVAQAKGLQTAVASEASDAEVLAGLQTMLAAIQTSMAA